MTTCFNFIRRTASATRAGSSSSRANGFAVVTAQNPQARVQRSPAIIIVAVPWLQHSQRFGHCALSQTVCNRKSEMSALVEKKTGFDGSRTLIQGGFCAWCSAGSIFAQDIEQSYNLEKKVTKFKSLQPFNALTLQRLNDQSFVRPESAAESVSSSADSRPPPATSPWAIRVRVTANFPTTRRINSSWTGRPCRRGRFRGAIPARGLALRESDALHGCRDRKRPRCA